LATKQGRPSDRAAHVRHFSYALGAGLAAGAATWRPLAPDQSFPFC